MSKRGAYSFTKPCVLTIGGSDGCCGAGIQADLKAISAQGCYGLTALTCVVAEVPDQVLEIKPLPASFVLRQIELLLDTFPIQAIKIGLLYSAAIVRIVAEALARLISIRKISLVVDPVMIASTGNPLVHGPVVSAYCKHLIPLTTVLTPNVNELSVFSNQVISTYQEMKQAGRKLVKSWGIALLLKGGHLGGKLAQDVLLTPFDGEWEYASPFQSDACLHGTGCTFSAAIASHLALGSPLEKAIGIAKNYMDLVIRSHLTWDKVKALEHFPSHEWLSVFHH